MALFLLAPSGSHGDVHPFIAVGKALQARGHRVAMSTSAHFEKLAREAGFEFDPVGTEADFQDTINDPNLWHPAKSLQVLFGGERFRRMLRENYQHLADRNIPGRTAIVAGSLSLGARLAHEMLGIPLATLHLQPMAFPSVSDPPVFPSFTPKSWWPRWLVQFIYWYGERHMIDPILAPTVNELRIELELKPMTRIWGAWRHSPQCILGLFPSWFGAARDWPPHMTCTGFVRYDQSATMALAPKLAAFLNAGEPPIVISFGSAMRTGRPHFLAAMEACKQLGQRGLILARGGEQIPTPLPPIVTQCDYAPFSLIFPRAAAIIHHGGVGTSAQALAAGVPQLVMPLAFDQFDCAHRLVKLGVARSVPAKRFTAQRAAAALRDLFEDKTVPVACAMLKAKMNDDAMPVIIEKLESIIGK